MSGGALVIRTLEDLKAFQNKEGVMEIAVRNANKRFKRIEKVIINAAQAGNQNELADKVLGALNQNNLLNQKNLKLLGYIAKINNLGFLLNGLNLCATCAGFAIMFAKLDKMSAEINQQINQVRKDMKDINDLHADYEFNKVLSEHTDMLDCEKKLQPYSEDKMRCQVDSEYNLLMLLISTLQKEVAGDREALVFSVFSMLAMFTVSLRKFDEVYYFNNHAALENQDPWHLAHGKWMSIYEKLSSDWFVERLQDIATFDMQLSADQTDAYYLTMKEQVSDYREEVEDNQTLILAFGNMEALAEYRKMSSKEVADAVEKAFSDADVDLKDSDVAAAYQNAMQQAAIA